MLSESTDYLSTLIQEDSHMISVVMSPPPPSCLAESVQARQRLALMP